MQQWQPWISLGTRLMKLRVHTCTCTCTSTHVSPCAYNYTNKHCFISRMTPSHGCTQVHEYWDLCEHTCMHMYMRIAATCTKLMHMQQVEEIMCMHTLYMYTCTYNYNPKQCTKFIYVYSCESGSESELPATCIHKCIFMWIRFKVTSYMYT